MQFPVVRDKDIRAGQLFQSLQVDFAGCLQGFQELGQMNV